MVAIGGRQMHEGEDWRLRAGAAVFRVIGPTVRRAIRAGLPVGPNVLLTVRGRRSGLARTTPVAMLELGAERFVQASFGEVEWVWNLRASGEAVITRGHRSERVRAVELAPEVAGPLLRDALAPFHRSALVRRLVGPSVRPPAAVMHRFRFRVDDALEDYIEDARRHPLFELRPIR
jgi:deazaflavin-dependent oxidoreductase (nitroreductase family)